MDGWVGVSSSTWMRATCCGALGGGGHRWKTLYASWSVACTAPTQALADLRRHAPPAAKRGSLGGSPPPGDPLSPTSPAESSLLRSRGSCGSLNGYLSSSPTISRRSSSSNFILGSPTPELVGGEGVPEPSSPLQVSTGRREPIGGKRSQCGCTFALL